MNTENPKANTADQNRHRLRPPFVAIVLIGIQILSIAFTKSFDQPVPLLSLAVSCAISAWAAYNHRWISWIAWAIVSIGVPVLLYQGYNLP